MSKRFWLLISILLGVFLFLGGLGVEVVTVQYFGVLVGILTLVLVALIKRKVVLPSGFFLYTLFLVLFFLHSLILSQNKGRSLEYFSLFLAGGLFWVTTYNLRKEFRPTFDKLIVLLGIIFGILFIYSHYFGEAQVKTWSLYLPYSAYLNHNSIGDLWSVVLTIVVFYIIQKPRSFWYWILATLGIYFLAMSQSRSAYFALAVGVLYLLKEHGFSAKNKKIFALFIFLAAALFIFTGVSKQTLLSRPYFVQALVGIFHNPLGVGVGNFGLISSDPENHIWGLSHFASNAHNIVLEIMTGMGILGLIFVIWLVKILRELWYRQDSRALVYQAAFFALAANFFFFSTYFIPTMLWLWFVSLGLAQTRVRR